MSFTVPIFSVGNLIAPLLRHHADRSPLFALLTIQVHSGEGWVSDQKREQVLAKIQELLAGCILPGMDVLLPTQHKAGKTHFWIVARTDAKGAQVMAKRIRERLSRCEQLQLAGIACMVSIDRMALHPTARAAPPRRQIDRLAAQLEKRMKSVSA